MQEGSRPLVNVLPPPPKKNLNVGLVRVDDLSPTAASISTYHSRSSIRSQLIHPGLIS